MLPALTLLAIATLAGPVATRDTTFRVPEDSRVTIENPDGAVTIRGGPGREARVVAEGGSGRVRVVAEGGRVTIRPPGWDGTDLSIELPRDVDVSVRNLDGEVTVSGLEGEIDIEVFDGAVSVAGGAGVRVASVDGDIEIDGARGPVSIESGDGDISVARITGPIAIEGIDGDIEVVGARSREVRVSTVSGDLLYEGSVDPGGTYVLDTHDGDIAFVVPEGTGATFTVSTFDGALEPAFPVELRNVEGGVARFTLEGGGADVRLESFDGDIFLLRPGDRTRRKPEHGGQRR